jgi:hypothetical protein
MGFYEAQLKLERARGLIDPARDPVMAAVVDGLVEMAAALNILNFQVQQIEHKLQSMRH